MSEPTGPQVKPIPEKNPAKRWIIIGAAVVGVALIAGVTAWALRPESEKDERAKAIAEIAKKPPVVLPSPGATSAPNSGGTTSSTSAPSGQGSAKGGNTVTLAPYVAYRFADKLGVVREDGAQPREVGVSAKGPYSLSPDGSTIAWVEDKDKSLYVLPVVGGQPVKVGPAQPTAPVWTPDSGHVLYVAGSASAPEVWQAAADGTVPERLAAGIRAAAGLRGEVVALLPGTEPKVTLIRGTVDRPLSAPKGTRDVAVGDGVIYYLVKTPVGGTEVYVARLDGGGAQKISSWVPGEKPADCGSLLLAPDGETLVYAEMGDDGYSRMYSVPSAGGTPKLLSTRRDGYPLRWTSDGGSVLFIEGNTLQGETSTLLRVRADGAGRIVVLSGATN